MPTNEILAASYSILHYTPVFTGEEHEVRLYFDEVPTYVDEETGYRFSTYTDALHPSGWQLAEIWEEVWNRLNGLFGATAIPASTIGEVEVWQSVPSAPNEFLGLDTASYDDVGDGGASGVASAYVMAVLKAANRAQFRFTIFDTFTATPQRYAGTPIPEVDNDTLQWFMVRSAVGFVTNDNLPLATLSSYNTGYNKALAKSYGRTKTS